MKIEIHIKNILTLQEIRISVGYNLITKILKFWVIKILQKIVLA